MMTELTGRALIDEKVKTLPSSPGVYRMLGRGAKTLYVGKARDLKKRVAHYARANQPVLRTERMVALTTDMEFLLARSESEALLLEAAMIKRFKPPFNILLRDDKSFASIGVLTGHEAPRLVKHRGKEVREGVYFGPFASAGAIDRTLTALQRAFLLRSCSDAVYAHRTRPCLLYQIKRCAAPCTGAIAPDAYARLVDEALAFLQGRNRDVQKRLAAQMEAASDALDFERAGLYRDRLHALEQIQAHPETHIAGVDDADVFAIHEASGQCCVELFMIRGGQNRGNRAYFPRHAREETPARVLEAFLAQFYEARNPPLLVLVNEALAARALLENALSLRAGKSVSVARPARGAKKDLITRAEENARGALARRLSESANQQKLLALLAERLGLPKPPERIEIYDNSHIQGTHPVGAMVVAGVEGFIKNQYRLFHIKTPHRAGDDYAMLREVLRRRFARLSQKDEAAPRPDLLLIDGGAGHLRVAEDMLAEADIGTIPLLGIAKGPDRHAGRERFFAPNKRAFTLDARDPVLYYLQRLRDEAHRFAIGRHRAQRQGAARVNPLDAVAGIGQKRKAALLRHFGSAKSVARASASELEAVEGISKTRAEAIHAHFHSR